MTTGNEIEDDQQHNSTGKMTITYCLYENDKDKVVESEPEMKKDIDSKKPYRMELVWRNILAMIVIHAIAIFGLGVSFLAKTETILFVYLLLIFGSLGVQAGAHRLWAHRTYKANFGVRLLLSLGHVVALQNDLYEWCRDHRAHHKFSDTDGDPHNSSRGFFFSHVGWLLCKKHPDVKRRGGTIDLSDLEADPIVMFQQQFYIPMVLLLWGILPTFIPVYYWNESFIVSMSFCVFTRYAVSLNATWLVNSWSHMYGYRPYNAKIAPVESSCRHLLMGEGFHNYHHAFPWDYSASELGAADVFNPATAFIDFFHYMGWAWDLKKVNKSLVEAKMKSSGEKNVYHKRNTPFYEWSTGLLVILFPLVLVLVSRSLRTNKGATLDDNIFIAQLGAMVPRFFINLVNEIKQWIL